MGGSRGGCGTGGGGRGGTRGGRRGGRGEEADRVEDSVPEAEAVVAESKVRGGVRCCLRVGQPCGKGKRVGVHRDTVDSWSRRRS